MPSLSWCLGIIIIPISSGTLMGHARGWGQGKFSYPDQVRGGEIETPNYSNDMFGLDTINIFLFVKYTNH